MTFNEKLKSQYKLAILRRDYAEDELLIYKQATNYVFSAKDRAALARDLESQFDIFILDDGFQHRKLKRDIDIVLMGAREFRCQFALIPANFFREPLTSLKRADIVVVNYANEINNREKIKQLISKHSPDANIFFASYKIKKFTDRKGGEIHADTLKDKPLAAFAAIGYPQGFFNKLKESGYAIKKELSYPDHHRLNQEEFKEIERSLVIDGIDILIITRKDLSHLPAGGSKLKIFVMDIDMEIEEEGEFLQEITKLLIAK